MNIFTFRNFNQNARKIRCVVISLPRIMCHRITHRPLKTMIQPVGDLQRTKSFVILFYLYTRSIISMINLQFYYMMIMMIIIIILFYILVSYREIVGFLFLISYFFLSWYLSIPIFISQFHYLVQIINIQKIIILVSLIHLS